MARYKRGRPGKITQKANGQPVTSDRKMIRWTTRMDRCLTELLLEQINLGRKVQSGFDKDAWAAVVPVLNARCGSNVTKEHCKNRLKTWKKIYQDVKILLGQNGFAWDEERKMVHADDQVWDDFVKGHPYVRQYKTKTVPNYDEMAIIVGDTAANGNQPKPGAETNTNDNNLDLDDVDLLEPATSGDLERGAEDTNESDDSVGGVDALPSQGARPKFATPLNSKQPTEQKKSIVESIAESMSEIASAIKLLANNGQAKANRMKTVYNEVKKIPSINNQQLFAACNLLASDENKAMMFLAIDKELRHEWLMMHLK